jgi:GNAT superfamily N-acetyltransferase
MASAELRPPSPGAEPRVPRALRLRRATIADVGLVLHHRRRMFEDMGEEDARVLDRMVEISRPLLERGLREGFYQGWFLEDQAGRVVAGAGLISLEFQAQARHPDPRRSWIVNVFTEPAHRRRGLAERLVRTIVAWGKDAGLRSLYLHASDHGRPLYDRLGFLPTNEMRLDLTVSQGDAE